MPKLRALALASACLLAALAALGAAPAAAARATACTTTLWTSGAGGYNTYRIPAIVNDGGTLVAFAEGRRNSSADNGDIEVVERRSTDGGCTWTPQQVAADAWTDTIGNEVPLVTADGTLVLVTDWQRGTVTQSQIQAGTVSAADGRRIFVQTSADQGATWTARREITGSVKRAAWLWYATGPGHGVTIQHGVALGRLVVSADHTELGSLRGAHTLISDDDGATWRIGAVDDHADGVITPDETTAAERLDGAMYFSSRNQSGSDPAHRAYTFSLSSGSTFSAPFRPAPALVTPIVEGSLLQDPGYPAGVTCAPLLYSGPEDPSVRQHLTLRRSDDGGVSWRDIAEITGPTVPAAYSDMVKVDRSQLGVLYETGSRGPYERIDWTALTLGCP
jgi:sialidase-1